MADISGEHGIYTVEGLDLRFVGRAAVEVLAEKFQNARDDMAEDGDEHEAALMAELAALFGRELRRRDSGPQDPEGPSPDWTPEIDPETGEPPEGDG